jgi:SHS2 domain-containing protein
MNSFEIVEHTADVGVVARGDTLEEAFRQAALGMLDIMGAFLNGPGEEVPIEVAARDDAALLVEWLSEILYLHESSDAVVTNVSVHEVSDGRARGSVTLAPRSSQLEGTAVKAITYHQLEVERDQDDWRIRVYVDI